MSTTLPMRREKPYIATEILIYIFFQFMAYNTNKAEALICLALVCREWQDITYQHCRFWLDVVGPDILESFLARLLPRSLTSVYSLSLHPRTSQFPEILATHLHQIDCLDLLIPLSLNAAIMNSLNGYAPYLREVKLIVMDDLTEDSEASNHTLLLTLFNGGAPLLNCLALLGITVPLSSTVFRGMHSIDLGPWNAWSGPQYPFIPLLDALRNAPSLEVVILTDCIQMADSNLSPDFVAHLPNLKILDVTGVSSDILTIALALVLPPSCHIQLCGRTGGDYYELLTAFMKNATSLAMHSMKLNIEVKSAALLFGLEGDDMPSKLQASFPDRDGHLLVIASTLFPMERIRGIAVRGNSLRNIYAAWRCFLPSWNRVRKLSLSGDSALDLLLALSHLGRLFPSLPRLSTLHLAEIDFEMATVGLNMTLADLVLQCLDQPRCCSMMLIVEGSRTTKQILASILESARQDVELEWDGEKYFSETESLVSEGEE